jgi:hypothetical protein
VPAENTKQSELQHFSHVATREDVLVLDPHKRAGLVEDAMKFLYRVPEKKQREDLLSLIRTVMKHDPNSSTLFTDTAYTVCNRHLVVTYVNDVFLKRSNVDLDEVVGKSLYYEREYEGGEIERLYSMVMETRLVADALVRYDTSTGFKGWFVIVVIPLDEGGIGVLSRFTKNKEEFVAEIDPNSADAPRFILMNK